LAASAKIGRISAIKPYLSLPFYQIGVIDNNNFNMRHRNFNSVIFYLHGIISFKDDPVSMRETQIIKA
jgi:hypothetical protein